MMNVVKCEAPKASAFYEVNRETGGWVKCKAEIIFCKARLDTVIESFCFKVDGILLFLL